MNQVRYSDADSRRAQTEPAMSEPTTDHKLPYEPPAAPRVIGGVSSAANDPWAGIPVFDGQYGYASIHDLSQF